MPEPTTPTEPDNEFAKDLAAAFASDEETANPTAPDPKAPADDSKKPEDPATPPPDTTKEEPKKDEPAKPEDSKDPAAPTADEKKSQEGTEPAKDPKAPATSEQPEDAKPLTKEDAASIFRDIQIEERTSTRVLEDTTKEVLDAYYPDGLSNVLTTPDGKELKSPQDVVDASNGEMTTEEAAQWLMNEQFKLDQSVKKIKDDARVVAETTINFRRDSIAAVRKYEPVFKVYPQLQEKTFNLMMKQVKADEKKGVVLSAPDVMDLYDTYLEPYRLAYEHSTKQSATNNTPDPKDTEKPKPGAEDRLDEGGDGGVTAPNDPNDFAQQVNKELAKGI